MWRRSVHVRPGHLTGGGAPARRQRSGRAVAESLANHAPPLILEPLLQRPDLPVRGQQFGLQRNHLGFRRTQFGFQRNVLRFRRVQTLLDILVRHPRTPKSPRAYCLSPHPCVSLNK